MPDVGLAVFKWLWLQLIISGCEFIKFEKRQAKDAFWMGDIQENELVGPGAAVGRLWKMVAHLFLSKNGVFQHMVFANTHAPSQ